jgi:formylglycine-generating enzyme required for sulfatase activity
MMYVPGDVAFPSGTDDSGEVKAYYPYWIGETEVTYELWNTVYTWATGNGYVFENTGTQGDGTGDTDQHPVTEVNWRDCMVWCNALTEWYNAENGTNFTCAYTYAGSIVRDSQDSNATACDNVVENSSATGFRLPSSNEWELAARWRTDSTNTVSGYSNPWFTQGDSASGATADYNDTSATGLVAWYNDNSGSSTHEVKGKAANSLGLYDMSGNVWEWCFTKSGFNRAARGGSWDDSADVTQVGYPGYGNPISEVGYVGFRFARTQ